MSLLTSAAIAGEQPQAVEIAIKRLVFAHDVTRRFQECAKRLRGGGSGYFRHVFPMNASNFAFACFACSREPPNRPALRGPQFDPRASISASIAFMGRSPPK